ncbi:hypothetical protein H5410_030620 [Solanum commersonii]|uniref:Uncharacterized protein n=1 Tax=Solanum commersonii TaxID=4109 RepID=A0A9J5YG55_SOLCO|nr:hypothetical protein H5410_030620 [Solanum commersonii]
MLISQMMQRIKDMQEKIQQTEDVAKLSIASYEPPLKLEDPILFHKPIISISNPPTIKLTIYIASYTNTSYQTPPQLSN